jgi:hypothetical protein
MIKLFSVKQKQREAAENANGRPPVKKQSAGELRLQKGLLSALHISCYCFQFLALGLVIATHPHDVLDGKCHAQKPIRDSVQVILANCDVNVIWLMSVADISELNLAKTTTIFFPNGKDNLLNFEITIRPDEGYYQ